MIAIILRYSVFALSSTGAGKSAAGVFLCAPRRLMACLRRIHPSCARRRRIIAAESLQSLRSLLASPLSANNRLLTTSNNCTALHALSAAQKVMTKRIIVWGDASCAGRRRISRFAKRRRLDRPSDDFIDDFRMAAVRGFSICGSKPTNCYYYSYYPIKYCLRRISVCLDFLLNGLSSAAVITIVDSIWCNFDWPKEKSGDHMAQRQREWQRVAASGGSNMWIL